MLTEVAPGVFVTTSAFAITNTVVIAGADGGCLVIDPGVLVTEMTDLAGELAARGLHPVVAWSTHPHWDHVLWHAALGEVPRYAAPAAVVITETERDGMVSATEASAPGHDMALFGRVTALEADTIPWGGPAAHVVVHNAHAPGHGAVFLPEAGVFAVGDMISDAEIPLLDTAADDPMGDYRTGLARLAAVAGVRQVIPGHGRVGDTAEFRRRIAADEAYLDQLAAGKSFGDPRITEGWIREAHAEHLRCFQQSRLLSYDTCRDHRRRHRRADGGDRAVPGRYAGWHESLLRLFGAADTWYKWALYGRDPIPRWTRGRVTVLGDAAHPMLPYLGQAGCQAIEDAAVLATALSAEAGDPLTGLARYELTRRPRASRVVLASRERGLSNHLTSRWAARRRDISIAWRRRVNRGDPEGRGAAWIAGYDASSPDVLAWGSAAKQ